MPRTDGPDEKCSMNGLSTIAAYACSISLDLDSGGL
jgi:hypothetical protein